MNSSAEKTKVMQNIQILFDVHGRKRNYYELKVKEMNRTCANFFYRQRRCIANLTRYETEHPYCCYGRLSPMYADGIQCGLWFGFSPDSVGIKPCHEVLEKIKHNPNSYVEDAAWLIANLISYIEQQAPSLDFSVETRIIYVDLETGETDFGDLRLLYDHRKSVEGKYK